MIDLLEDYMKIDNISSKIVTKLAILYAEHKQERVKSLIDVLWQKFDETEVINAFEKANLWSNLLLFFDKKGNYDKALHIMMLHSKESWNEQYFLDNISKIVEDDTRY